MMDAASPIALMTTVADAVALGARTLQRCSESPRLDAELLLGKILGLSRAALIARSGDAVADPERAQL